MQKELCSKYCCVNESNYVLGALAGVLAVLVAGKRHLSLKLV